MDRQELIWSLSRVEAPTLPCHWIVTPAGDHGHEWCPRCGRAKVRNMRSRDRKNRDGYILDGGWRTSRDHLPVCHGCGAHLNGALTSYGASVELDYYEEAGLSDNPAVDALYLSEIIDNLPDDDGRLELALGLASQTLLALKDTSNEQ